MNDKTDIEQTLKSYWDNYQNDIPVKMLYESQLRQCKLDESLDSLKELDIFLSHVRKAIQDKLTKAGRILSAEQRKALLLKDERFCKLVQFIGFYTGKVLSKAWESSLLCHDEADLHAIYQQQLRQGAEQFFEQPFEQSFEHSLAVTFVDIDKREQLQDTKVKYIQEPWLFFVLEPVFMRLFGGFDYQVRSIQGQLKVANGLYHAVLERLPQAVVEQISLQQDANHQPVNQLKSQTEQVSPQIDTVSQVSETSQASRQVNSLDKTNIAEKLSTKPLTASSTTKMAQSAETQLAEDILADIRNLPISHNEQSADDKDYLQQYTQSYVQMSELMYQFDNAIKQQPDNVALEQDFTEQEVASRKKALETIKLAAANDNTTAMLHLSAYLLSGQWVEKNVIQATSLIQQAAKKQDYRAMRALSNMYYQGLGVSQDTALGNHWIEQAANLGHPEAKQVMKQLTLAKVMLAERQDENKSDKQYLYVIGAIVLFALLIIILL